MTLLDFWPLPDALPTPDSDAAFLAAYRPLRVTRGDQPADERAVLDALLAGDVVTVGGDTSQLRRWLKLHLPAGRFVVREPKGAGLHAVLEAAADLLPLAAPAGVDPTAPPTEEELLAQVREKLLQRAAAAKAACDTAFKETGKVDPQQRAVAETHGPGLVAVLDGPTRATLLGAVPLASGAEFTPAHFEFASVPSHKLTDVKLQRYVQKLKTNMQNERVTAAALLNEVRAEVLSQPVAPAPVPPTAEDEFRRLRAALAAEGKELVLLFDTAGTVRADAEPGLCAVRAAVFTPNAESLDFVATEESLSEDDAVEQVGALLNAARLGAMPALDAAELLADDRTALEAFGRSAGGYPLFPFNRAAVRALTVAKPVADVVRGVLAHRETFARGAFPPAGFAPEVRAVGDDVRTWLQQQRTDDHERYGVLLGVWGGAPQRPDEVTLPAGVYAAFGLAPLPEFVLAPEPREVPPEPVLPAEVEAFLAAAESPEGASIALLTPTVIGWLYATNHFETYRVRR